MAISKTGKENKEGEQMKYLLIGLIIGISLSILCWIAEDSIKHNKYEKCTTGNYCEVDGHKFLVIQGVRK